MAKQFLNILCLKNFALTQSLIEYGIVAWGGAVKTIITSIRIAQNMILKIIYKKPRLTPNILLNIETLTLTVKQLYFKNHFII